MCSAKKVSSVCSKRLDTSRSRRIARPGSRGSGPRGCTARGREDASEADAAVGAGDVVEELVAVLADEGLLVVAGDVVPGDAVVVDVVEDREAGLLGAVDVELGVVGLAGLLVTGLRPGVEAPSSGQLVRGGHLFTVRRPEPAVDRLGFQVTSVLAALEVAEAA